MTEIEILYKNDKIIHVSLETIELEHYEAYTDDDYPAPYYTDAIDAFDAEISKKLMAEERPKHKKRSGAYCAMTTRKQEMMRIMIAHNKYTCEDGTVYRIEKQMLA